MNSDTLLLFVDGSVRFGSRAGIGVVVATPDGMPLRRFGQPLPHPATAHEAEYIALIHGLQEALRLGASQVEVHLDSELVQQQVLGNWQCHVPHLQTLRDQARSLLARFTRWTLHRVPSPQNPLAHTLANVASTQVRTRHKKEVKPMQLVVTAPTPTLPDDVYTVELVDVQETRGDYGLQFTWQLRIVGGKHDGTPLRAWTNASTAVNSKAVRFASAFHGQPFGAGDRIDLEALKGKRARAVVQNHTRADGRTVAKVTDILPPPPPDEDDPFA